MNLILNISISKESAEKIYKRINSLTDPIILIVASIISVAAFFYFLNNGLGLAYNDARSHLDIARRVVEGLKPGLAQLGSVWLPLPHFLMIPFVVNDTFWHTGFAGAVISMVSFVATIFFLIKTLNLLKSGPTAKVVAFLVFALNLNVLYLQSTAMTEMLLIGTMSAATYFLVSWAKEKSITNLIWSAFFMMLSTLVRYDGWFLLLMSTVIIATISFKSQGKKTAEGLVVFFLTLASVGVVLWFLWNLLIFKDPLYFAFGPYSAKAQQAQIAAAGQLQTKGDIFISLKTYWFAMIYSVGLMSLLVALGGAVIAFFSLRKQFPAFLALSTFFAPIIFNVVALFLGHSVLFVPGVAGDTWFNVRYGIMALPAVAIFIGILVDRAKSLRWLAIGLLLFVGMFTWRNMDAVTIDDARVGSSQKNVSQVAGWLNSHAKDSTDYILISVASHDAIVFSSGLPMKRFIHEGTGSYWENATKYPDRFAKYIVVRTNDLNDGAFFLLTRNDPDALTKYDLTIKGDFADVYELKEEYKVNLPKEPLPILKK